MVSYKMNGPKQRDTFRKRVNVRTFALTYSNYEYNAFLDNALDRCQMVNFLLTMKGCQAFRNQIRSILQKFLLLEDGITPSIKYEVFKSYLLTL